jgi:MerR family gold-responsive transcriptional activator of gol and ges genes
MVGTLYVQVDLKARARERDRVRIGELVTLLGVEAHVLRHWEDEGLLHPDRGINGYRTYGEEQVTRARVVVGCRQAGLSIPAIRSLLHRDWPGREAVLRTEIAEIESRERELTLTRTFLQHVIECRHPLMHRCVDCSDYANRR